ncbi:MAG: hypothetical protein PHP45_04675 [Elusimicrobiales bacterium]|nr:hypothetical protein [Elusimicrobiales bacterium]
MDDGFAPRKPGPRFDAFGIQGFGDFLCAEAFCRHLEHPAHYGRLRRFHVQFNLLVAVYQHLNAFVAVRRGAAVAKAARGVFAHPANSVA